MLAEKDLIVTTQRFRMMRKKEKAMIANVNALETYMEIMN